MLRLGKLSFMRHHSQFHVNAIHVQSFGVVNSTPTMTSADFCPMFPPDRSPTVRLFAFTESLLNLLLRSIDLGRRYDVLPHPT